MSQAALEAGLQTKLTADQTAGTFYAAVSGRIYQAQAPDDSALPLAVWLIASDSPDSVFGGDDLEVEVQFDLFGQRDKGFLVLGQAQDKLFTLLQYQAVTISGFTGGHARCIDRGQRSVEDDALRIMSRWQIRATAA